MEERRWMSWANFEGVRKNQEAKHAFFIELNA
jgi:hypothetical protein